MPCLSSGVCVELVSGTFPCSRIAAAAAKMSASRRSFRESLSMRSDRVEEWLEVIVTRGYTSVLEHCVYSFEVVCSRVCSHQLVRHRIASYTQQSMRWSEGFARDTLLCTASLLGVAVPERPESRDDYLAYSKLAMEAAASLEGGSLSPREALRCARRGFIIPPSIAGGGERLLVFLASVYRGLGGYYRLLYEGVPREDARFAIPHAVKTRILVTMNARELLDVFFPLRLCTRAQWEIRSVAWLMLHELLSREPLLWRYAGPRCLRLSQLAGTPCTLAELLEERCPPGITRCPEGVPRHAISGCVKSGLCSVWLQSAPENVIIDGQSGGFSPSGACSARKGV